MGIQNRQSTAPVKLRSVQTYVSKVFQPLTGHANFKANNTACQHEKSVELNVCLPGSYASTARVFSRTNYGWTEENTQLNVGVLHTILTVQTLIYHVRYLLENWKETRRKDEIENSYCRYMILLKSLNSCLKTHCFRTKSGPTRASLYLRPWVNSSRKMSGLRENGKRSRRVQFPCSRNNMSLRGYVATY